MSCRNFKRLFENQQHTDFPFILNPTSLKLVSDITHTQFPKPGINTGSKIVKYYKLIYSPYSTFSKCPTIILFFSDLIFKS